MTSARASQLALVLAAFLASVFGSSCDGTISVTFQTGAQEFAVSTDALTIPMELRDGDRIAAAPCGPMGLCPPSDVVTITCEAGVCDPAPKTVTGVGGVIDVSALLAETREVGLRVVDAYEVLDVAYDVQLNTLTVPTAPVEVYWGPSSATTVDESLGVRHFGTIPAIQAGQMGAGQLALDGAGVAALSDYLVDTAPQVRFLVQTTVDLDPGDPVPEGSVRVSVNATVRAVGSIVD